MNERQGIIGWFQRLLGWMAANPNAKLACQGIAIIALPTMIEACASATVAMLRGSILQEVSGAVFAAKTWLSFATLLFPLAGFVVIALAACRAVHDRIRRVAGSRNSTSDRSDGLP